MNRVLQIVAGLNRGGLESFVMNMYRVIDKNLLQFDFLVLQESGDFDNEIKELGGRIFRLPPRNKGYFAYINALDSFFKENASQYIACHQHVSSLTSIEALKFAYKYGIPVRVIHSHNSTISNQLPFRFLHIFLHYLHKPFVRIWATHYLGCSDKAIKWMYDYTGVYSKAIMCNNGIDSDLYGYNPHTRIIMRSEFCIADDELVIGHVGRFERVKNQVFLLDILQSLIENGEKVKLIMVGTGPLLNQIKELAIEKRIEDRIIFTGVRSDVYKVVQAMDVFVMPSLFEGLPVTLVEAQAAGLPIVASDTISHDADITGTIIFKSLNDSAVEWGKVVKELNSQFIRADNREQIKRAGFDSTTTANQLIDIYLGNV